MSSGGGKKADKTFVRLYNPLTRLIGKTLALPHFCSDTKQKWGIFVVHGLEIVSVFPTIALILSYSGEKTVAFMSLQVPVFPTIPLDNDDSGENPP